MIHRSVVIRLRQYRGDRRSAVRSVPPLPWPVAAGRRRREVRRPKVRLRGPDEAVTAAPTVYGVDQFARHIQDIGRHREDRCDGHGEDSPAGRGADRQREPPELDTDEHHRHRAGQGSPKPREGAGTDRAGQGSGGDQREDPGCDRRVTPDARGPISSTDTMWVTDITEPGKARSTARSFSTPTHGESSAGPSTRPRLHWSPMLSGWLFRTGRLSRAPSCIPTTAFNSPPGHSRTGPQVRAGAVDGVDR